MSNYDRKHGIIHGYVAVIGPESNPNYFTGVGYTSLIDDAQVFKTRGGSKRAAQYWQYSDHNPRPLAAVWFSELRSVPVRLGALEPMI